MFLMEFNSLNEGKVCININQITLIENVSEYNRVRINFVGSYVMINESYESVIRQIMEAK